MKLSIFIHIGMQVLSRMKSDVYIFQSILSPANILLSLAQLDKSLWIGQIFALEHVKICQHTKTIVPIAKEWTIQLSAHFRISC